MKTPFKLKSGNVTPFKQMGSSPAKQKTTKGAIKKASWETPGPIVRSSEMYNTPPQKSGTSKKIGPGESPESMKNKKIAYKDAMRGAGFDATKGERKSVFETYDDLQEAKAYKKHTYKKKATTKQ